MIVAYGRLLTHPGVTYLLAVNLVVRLCTPVLSLALLLAVVDQHDSYAAAGLALTCHALGVAACAPIGGRLADRFGARLILSSYLVAHALAYSLILLSFQSQASATIAAAALLGASTPPVSAVARSAWPRLVPSDLLPTAYAMDNAINEVMFIAGPLLVPLLMLAIPAHAVVIVAGAALLLGTVLLLLSATVRRSGVEPSAAPQNMSRWRRLVGPLTHRPTLTMLVIAAFGTASFGCLRIATAAEATEAGSAASAGVLMGLLAAGALAGTIGYGAQVRRLNGKRLLVVLSVAETIILLGGTIAPGFATIAVLMVVAGLVTGPRDALQPVLLTDDTPARYHTEVFAWLSTFMWTGYGLGSAIAGRLTGSDDNGTPAFVAAATAALLGALLTALAYRPSPLALVSARGPGSRAA
ncbi:major facilitator superfamily MFS_1 [Kribbella flavida DSM 17836]|uniref:Major facilitator superfamily MFS_1 n=1 Tax=Kribbella flavida (strain DSM 17836 / JCM 10339 / NBRC 14399) TaxID=479435 RepID=D2PSH5_KRIFD|nr:MFS transporter [Kribbella flavida]ADB33113.1 major facilitator superfamily MFS_1 [Kribbella flavida DSM 17836]